MYYIYIYNYHNMVLNMVIQYLPLNDPFHLGTFCGFPRPPIWSQRPVAAQLGACAFRFSAHARAASLALAPAMAKMMTEIRDFQVEKTMGLSLYIYILIHLLMLLVSYHTYTYIYGLS